MSFDGLEEAKKDRAAENKQWAADLDNAKAASLAVLMAEERRAERRALRYLATAISGAAILFIWWAFGWQAAVALFLLEWAANIRRILSSHERHD